MKKLLLTFVFLAGSLGLFAQKGLHLGVKGAPQSTWMFNGDDSDNANWEYVMTFGYFAGGSFSYFFSDGVGAGIDVLYSQQGQRFDFNGQSFHNKISYLKIPVLFHYHSSYESTGFFYLNAGPQFGLLMNASTETEVPFLGNVGLSTTDQYESLNIGAVLGLGAGFNLTDFLQLTAGLRFDFAFTDAEDKSSAFFSLDPNRPPTNNATGAFEIGLRYVLRSN